MNGKSLLLVVMVLAAITAGVYTCKEFNRRPANLVRAKPAYEVQVTDLLHEFSNNDSSANKKYLGKIVTVSGQIKKIDYDEDGYYTVVLGDSMQPSSVFCAMDTVYGRDASKLQPVSSVSVKGYFIGFEKDETGLLGSDVKLNRCVIEKEAH